MTTQAKLVYLRPQKARIRGNVGIVAARAHTRGVQQVRIKDLGGFMTIKAKDRIGGSQNHVTRVRAILNIVAGSTPLQDGSMNISAGRVVGMAFQAVCTFVDASGMRNHRAAQAWGKQRNQ
jgi:hypothetical protein